ncbi:MAG: PEGA domain-containing protein [Kiritimatiellae bacterium]|nr:PEGA domain-containing protein [Kiritimatiellia bacterium]
MKPTILTAATLVLAATSTVLAQAPAGDASVPQGTKKLMLKISTVETPDTRMQKQWSPAPPPMEATQPPHSEADIMNADPQTAARYRQENDNYRDQMYRIQANAALKSWEENNQHMKDTWDRLANSAFGKQVIIAVDKFAGEAATYFDSDCIEFFHLMDMDEGQKAQFMQDMSDPGMLAAPYFIKLVFDTPREESGVVSMNGQQIKMTKYMQTVTYSVQDNQGKMITGGNVKQEKQKRTTAAIQTSGTAGNEQVEVLEMCLAEVAKRINDHFVAKVSFTLTGPKKDEDFDENAGTIMVDDDGHTSGDEFSILKGPHIVEVEMEGYKRSGSPKLSISKSQNYKIPMASSLCEVTIQIKGPAGDEEFDADSATITLAGDEEFSPSNGEPEKVPQGKYKLTVELDGYETFEKTVSFSTPTAKQAVTLKKAKAAE